MHRHILNNSRTILRKRRIRFFRFPNIAKNVFHKTIKVVKILTENLNFRIHLSNFGAKNTITSGTLKTKKRIPKHFLNNSKTTWKTLRKLFFSTPKKVKNYPSKPDKLAKFVSQICIFVIIYQHLELKYNKK